MNFGLIWDLLRIIFTAGAIMEALPPGGVAHSTDAGIPPAIVTWRDGRRFEVALHITRTQNRATVADLLGAGAREAGDRGA